VPGKCPRTDCSVEFIFFFGHRWFGVSHCGIANLHELQKDKGAGRGGLLGLKECVEWWREAEGGGALRQGKGEFRAVSQCVCEFDFGV